MTTEANAAANAEVINTPAATAAPEITAPAPAPAAEADSPTSTPHSDRLEEIVARRRERLEEELNTNAEISGVPIEPAPAPAAATAAPATAAQPTHTSEQVNGNPPAAAPVAGGAQPAVAADGVTLLVNGREIVASQEDLVRLAQRGLSSDERYQEAARMRNDAQRLMGFVAPQQQQQIQQQGAPQAQPAARTNAPAIAVDDTRIKAIADRMSYGSQDDQAQAIRELLEIAGSANGQGQLQQSLTPEQVFAISQQAALGVAASQTFEQNLQTVYSEFPDVINDRPLMVAAADRVQALRNFHAQQGVQKPDLELYREACTFIKDRYLTPKGNAENANADPANSVQATTEQAASNVISMTSKLERKRAAPQAPAAASKIATEQGRPASPNASQIVQQMRKSRHQPLNT